MATATASKSNVREFVFEWEGKDKNGKIVRGELRTGGEAAVSATLRRQGIRVTMMPWRRRLAETIASPPARCSPRTTLPFLSLPSHSNTNSLMFFAARAVAIVR